MLLTFRCQRIKTFSHLISTSFFIFIFLTGTSQSYSQTLLDNFEMINNWKIYKSDGAEAAISSDKGYDGNAIKFDYNFTKGTGYAGIQKIIPMNLPENYQFTFYIKAESPANNLEFKLLDSTGQNVWWVIKRNFTFPTEWT